MLRGFAGGVVQRLEGRARELELPARLKRNRPAASLVGKADGVIVLDDRRPAGARLHAVQEGPNAPAAVIGHGGGIGFVERDLLVFGAEPPGLARLLAGGDPFHELRPRTNRGRIGYVPRHASPHQKARSRRADSGSELNKGLKAKAQ
jgi:hypothetical protein